ncbi:uncharacterized protein [Montipora capricornis]|uniref:uncharacterized protein n=1 Tax=Montipora capricornis TaxID=246305 RepID=UPI0035F209B9
MCCTEEGEVVKESKIKQKLRSAQQKKLKDQVSGQPWQGKLIAFGWEEEQEGSGTGDVRQSQSFSWLWQWRTCPTYVIAGVFELYEQLLPTRVYQNHVTVDSTAKSVILLEMSCPWMNNREIKSCEKTEKYAQLRLESKRQFPGYQVKQFNIVMDVLGGYSEELESTIRSLVGVKRERSKQRFLNGTNGIILFYTYYQECMYPHYSWQIAARKGEKVKLEVQHMDVSAWNGSCTLGYVEIQNGTYADGKPITRMCSYLLSGIETFYSHEGQSVGVHVEVANMDLYGWWWIYFEATYTVISYNDTVSNECYNYGFLNESNRAMTYVNRSNGNLCDSTLSGWYRFSGEAGTQMADSCPKIHHCSTDSPGWLNGTHPTVAEGIVQRKVCFLQHPHGIDCCYFSKDISVRNCGAFYVYRLDPPRCYSRYCGNGLPQAPECSNYKFLNDSNISATYTLYEQSYHSCKDNFKPGWYRFGGEAGNQMADTCVKMCHCGAWYPGWLTGGHPSVEDGAAVRKVCFVRGLGCCEASEYISVRNCSGFYVYNLTSISSSSCYYGYCASTGFEEPTTSGAWN